MPTENASNSSSSRRRANGRRRRRTSMEEVMARADVEAQNHHEQQQQQHDMNVMSLEQGSWCNVDDGSANCIIQAAIPIVVLCDDHTVVEAVETRMIGVARSRTTSSSSYCSGSLHTDSGTEDASIAAFAASLSRSFGASFDSTMDEATNINHDNDNKNSASSSSSDDDDDDDGNNVVTTTTAADDVILEMDEEGAIESSIIATATAKSIFVDIGQYLYYNNNSSHNHQGHLETAVSTDSTTVATTTTTATGTETSIEVVHPCMARAEFVSATFIKRTTDDFVGIALTSDDDTSTSIVRIAAIHPNSVLYNNHSPLRVGDQLLSISGQSCFELCSSSNSIGRGAAASAASANRVAAAAQTLLDQAPAGIVSLVARNPTGSVQYVETMVEKPRPNAPVGIAMKSSEYGSLLISNVVASGLFAHSLLNVGDRVISINHEYCPQGLAVQVAIDMIRDAPRFVCILTETQSRAGVVVPSAEVGLRSTVIPTDAQGRPLSAAAVFGWRRYVCCFVVTLTVLMVIVVLDLLVFHPL
jgi:hypothetical protein